MKIILLFTILIAVSGFAPPSIDLNNEGVAMFKDEKYDGAFKNFVDALSRDPHNPTLHFNLANNFHKNNENEKALIEFEAVENSPKAIAELKFKAMFNAGNVAVGMKDLDKAMKYYQRALDYNPNSQETKTNIELALREQKGGGESDKDQKDQKDKQDQKDKDKKDKDGKDKDQKDQPKDQDKQGQKQQPKPFKSQALNESDVRRILEELKRQEQEIRAKQGKQNKKNQDQNIEKDW